MNTNLSHANIVSGCCGKEGGFEGMKRLSGNVTVSREIEMHVRTRNVVEEGRDSTSV